MKTVAEQKGKGLIFIRAVAYDVTYTVKIGKTQVASYTTPSADDKQPDQHIQGCR